MPSKPAGLPCGIGAQHRVAWNEALGLTIVLALCARRYGVAHLAAHGCHAGLCTMGHLLQGGQAKKLRQRITS